MNQAFLRAHSCRVIADGVDVGHYSNLACAAASAIYHATERNAMGVRVECSGDTWDVPTLRQWLAKRPGAVAQ